MILRLKQERAKCGRLDRAAYRERNRLKQHRAIATRHEKLQEPYQALRTVAAILLWL